MSYLKLYRVTDNLIDVFQGDGWENWTRIFRHPKTKQIVHVKGSPLTAVLISYVKKEINK